MYGILFIVFCTINWTHQHLTYPINYCNMAAVCIHDNRQVCAASPDGCSKRTFIDQCDMYEYNCDYGTGYGETYYLYCITSNLEGIIGPKDLEPTVHPVTELNFVPAPHCVTLISKPTRTTIKSTTQPTSLKEPTVLSKETPTPTIISTIETTTPITISTTDCTTPNTVYTTESIIPTIISTPTPTMISTEPPTISSFHFKTSKGTVASTTTFPSVTARIFSTTTVSTTEASTTVNMAKTTVATTTATQSTIPEDDCDYPKCNRPYTWDSTSRSTLTFFISKPPASIQMLTYGFTTTESITTKNPTTGLNSIKVATDTATRPTNALTTKSKLTSEHPTFSFPTTKITTAKATSTTKMPTFELIITTKMPTTTVATTTATRLTTPEEDCGYPKCHRPRKWETTLRSKHSLVSKLMQSIEELKVITNPPTLTTKSKTKYTTTKTRESIKKND